MTLVKGEINYFMPFYLDVALRSFTIEDVNDRGE